MHLSEAVRQRLRNIVVGLTAIFCLFLVYRPAFLVDFGFHNDYRVRDVLDHSFDTSTIRGMLKHLESMHLLYIGRPVNALAFNLHQSFFHSTQDFAWGRAATFFLTVIVALFWYRFLRRQVYLESALALVLTLGVFSLPSMQLYVLWVANFVPGTLNLAIVAAASSLVRPAWQKAARMGLGRRRVRIAAAFLMLQVALFNYPPTALFLLIFLFAFVAFYDGPIEYVERIAKRMIALMVVALGAYFLLYKGIYFPVMREYWGSEFHSYDPNTYDFSLFLNSNPLNFIGEAVLYGFAAWAPVRVGNIAFWLVNLTVVVLAPILWVALSPNGPEGETFERRLREGFRRLKILLFIALLCLLPFLVSPKSFIAYRVEVAWFSLVAIAIISGYLLIFRLVALYSRTLAIATAMTGVVLLGFAAECNVRNVADNAGRELAFFRQALAPLKNAPRGEPADILVILPPRFSRFVDADIELDLAYTATNYSGLMYGIIHMIAEELLVPRNRYRFRSIDAAQASACKACLRADIVVDMRKLVR